MELSLQATQILGLLAAVVLAGSVTVWGLIVVRLYRRQQVVPQEKVRPVPWGWLEVGLILLIYLASQYVSVGIARSLVADQTPDAAVVEPAEPDANTEADAQQASGEKDASSPEQLAAVLAATAVGNLITLVIGGLLLMVRCRARWRDLGVDGRHFITDLGLGVMGFVALVVPVYTLMALLVRAGVEYQHPVHELILEDPTGPMLLLSLFLASIMAPVFEEFMFRLVLQGRLEKLEARYFGPPRPKRRKASADDDATETIQPPPAALDPLQNPFASPATVANSEHGPESPDAEPPQTETGPTEVETPGPPPEPVPPLADKFPGYPRGVAPIMSSSLLFALAHWGQGPAPIPLFVLALGLGYLFQRTHRLLPCIVVHMLLNTCSVVMMWLAATS